MTPRGPRQAAILALFTKPGQYLLSADIVEAMGIDPRGTYQCLHSMVGMGMLHALRAPVGSRLTRYFATAGDADAGRMAFDAERAGIAPSRRKPQPPKPAKPKMVKPLKACLPPSNLKPPMRGRHSQGLAQDFSSTKSPEIARDDPRIQRSPAWTHDPRFQCAPNERPAGAGFLAQWEELRGAA